MSLGTEGEGMDRDERDGTHVEVALPVALRARIDELFVAHRGYEPTSIQESLSVVCDLAEAELGDVDAGSPPRTREHAAAPDPSTAGSTSDSSGVELPDEPTARSEFGSAPAGPTPDQPAAATPPAEVVDEAFPAAWRDGEAEAVVPELVAAYATARDGPGDDDPLDAALRRVAAERDREPAALESWLLEALYDTDSLPTVVAREFLADAVETAAVDPTDPTDAADPDALPPGESDAADPFDSTADTVSFDDLVDGLGDSADVHERTVEALLETEHADGVVREVAAELIEEMTGTAFDELEHGVDEGTGTGLADGMGAVESPTGSPSLGDSEAEIGPGPLLADPETDCAVCGEEYRVSVLETTIRPGITDSVDLVCPGCAEELED